MGLNHYIKMTKEELFTVDVLQEHPDSEKTKIFVVIAIILVMLVVALMKTNV